MQNPGNTDKLILVPYTMDHLLKTFHWIQKPSLRKSFLFFKPITIENHQIWFENYLKDDSQKIFAITYEGNHVGNIGLKYIDNLNKTAETWIYIGETSYMGNGIASISYNILFKWLIENAFLKIFARIVSFNIPSILLYEKLGFIQIKNKIDEITIEENVYEIFFYSRKL